MAVPLNQAGLLQSDKFSVFSFQFSEKDRGPAPGGIGRSDQSSRCAEKPCGTEVPSDN
jgi:hypothetical protein